MLKGIPLIISPDLMKIMMEMGHGDELIIADGNYPARSQGIPVVSMYGHNVANLFEAILKFLPLDTYVKKPISLMKVVEGDPTTPTIWESYYKILENNGYDKSIVSNIDRYEFYNRSKKAFAIISTSDKALYANILLKKGVIS